MRHCEIIAINECKKANATGVEHFLNGNLSASIHDFTHGLTLAREILYYKSSDVSLDLMEIEGKEEQQDLSSSNDHFVDNDISAVVAVPLHHRNRNSNSNNAVDKLSSITSSKDDRVLHYVYKTPLEIAASTADFSRYEAKVELTVAIIFNLALCHHLIALLKTKEDEQEQRGRLLDQALSLYELAYMFQVQEDTEVSVECTMAIINNLGRIHHTKGNYEQASRCFRHLLSTILFVHSFAGDDDCDDAVVRPPQTEVFVRSVSHLILKEVVAPAA